MLELLVSQDIIEQDKASMITSLVSSQDRKSLHPLEIIANRQWINKSRPEQTLTLDVLTNWLAEQSGLARYHFDPLKMDVTSCTSIVSYAYASRFGILPVEVTDSEVVIAVTDPYNQEWMDELDRIVNKPISRMLANPQEEYTQTLWAVRSFERAQKYRPKDDTLPVISVQNVDAAYGDTQILFDVSFDIYAGMTVAVVGESGSGKSTAARCITGLLPPTAGRSGSMANRFPLTTGTGQRISCVNRR